MEKLLTFNELEREKEQILKSGRDYVEKLVDAVISQAVLRRASDIHILPQKDRTAVKYRIDGILYPVMDLPADINESLMIKLKVMANLIVYKKDIPQDGNISLPDKNIEMRVTLFPTCYGEKGVIRILDSSLFAFELENLGFSGRTREDYENLIARPNGVIILTGPANSGKTTTIYATIQKKIGKDPRCSIVSVEDPVEFRFDNISQTQITNSLHLTYARALKSILRQDPDIIVVGEIRDSETAKMVMEAGLTGHLVFSTIHSGTSASVLVRLLEMGIEPFLLSSALSGILSQRLVRKICGACGEKYRAGKENEAIPENTVLYRGKGCETCSGTGYNGRALISEMVTVDDSIREAILKKYSLRQLQALFREKGLKTLFEDGIEKAKEGITTIDELERILQV